MSHFSLPDSLCGICAQPNLLFSDSLCQICHHTYVIFNRWYQDQNHGTSVPQHFSYFIIQDASPNTTWSRLLALVARWTSWERFDEVLTQLCTGSDVDYIAELIQSFVSDSARWKSFRSVPVAPTIRSRFRQLAVKFWQFRGSHGGHDDSLNLPTRFLIRGSHVTHVKDLPLRGTSLDVCKAKMISKKKQFYVTCKHVRHVNVDVRRIKKLYQEFLIWQNLDHPYISPVFGIIGNNDPEFQHQSPSIVLPWMMNGNIRDFMKKLTVKFAQRNGWIHEIACGVGYLHGLDIVHCDLRGANILLDDNEQIVITDIGLSVYSDDPFDSLGRPSSSRNLLPHRWSAPEQLKVGTQQRKTKETDIWAFGCIVMEIYTGQDPFPHVGPHEMEEGHWIHHLDIDEYKPFIKRPYMMSENWWDIVSRKCWNWNPADRIGAKDLIDELRME